MVKELTLFKFLLSCYHQLHDFSSLRFFPLLSHRLCFLVRPRIKNMRYIASECAMVFIITKTWDRVGRSKDLGHKNPLIRKELFG